LETFKEKDMGKYILNDIQSRRAEQSIISEKNDDEGFFSNLFGLNKKK
jgi:hypothetical protein